MIDIAQRHEDELKSQYLRIWGNDYFKFYNLSSYNFTIEKLPKDDYNSVHLVTLDFWSGEVIGYVNYDIDRISKIVTNISAINFTRYKMFGFDLIRIFKSIFEKSDVQKIKFQVIVGNSSESKYDRLINRFGGSIVGTFKNDVLLSDGKYYDVKHYEITKDNYGISRNNRNNQGR